MEVSFVSIGSLVVLAAAVILTWRVLNWVWLKPKKLEALLRKQGISGNSYTFLVGDLKKNARMLTEARSKPINLTDDISPRVVPFFTQAVMNHGKTSFTWLGPSPRLTITNPEQIKEMLNKSDDFKKTRFNPLFKMIAPGLVIYEGEKWAKHRKIINPAFHLQKLKNMVPAFHESCSEMIHKWEEKVSDKGSPCEVDVWPYLVNLTGDVISRTAFGSCYEEGKRIFQLQDELARLTIQAVQNVYFPGWRFVPTKLHRRMKSIDREMTDILKGIIGKKEKAMKAGEAQNDDLLGILLESNSGQDRGSSMSIKDVIDECKLFYFAGQETTSVLLVWTMVLLSYHQDWQTRAREEVLQVFGKNKPDLEGLSQLKVVTMILNEVLRLYPPAILLTRAAHKELKLGDLTIPAGVILTVPTLLVHRDRELWGDDALEFKPERFADGVSKATKNRVSFVPFGWGPRICIGQNFAMLEAKMAMALILQRFSFELSPSYAHAPYTVITLHPQFGAHLMLQKI